MSEFYWILILYDGESIKVKPENVELIQAKLTSGGGFIRTATRSIAINSIKDFVETSERYIDQKLLEDGSRAFGELIIENDSVLCRWVKKSVPRREYTKYYAPHTAYRKLEDKDSYIVIAWRQPVHQIDSQKMDELSPTEQLNISRLVK